MKKLFLFLIVALMLFAGLPVARAQVGNAFSFRPQHPDNQLETRGYLIVEAAQASALPEASASPSPGAPPPGGVFIKTEYAIAFGAVVVAVFIVLFVKPKRRH